MKYRCPPLLLFLALGPIAIIRSQEGPAAPPSANRPDRLEWFRDQGFGLFIHWSVDSPLGAVISHTVVGASDDYVNRFYRELPAFFNPRQFQPEDWAALARLAGIKYVVFTAKHDCGFCMFDTATTDFGIMHTPFKRDMTREILQAFRSQGISAGLYFSPDDFLWLHQHGITIQRTVPEVQPAHNPGLLAYDQAQVRELLTHYGPIDVFFIDGEPAGLRDLAWRLNPNIVVTRGAMPTPEMRTLDEPLDQAWESCTTIGTAWQYQPTLDVYKSGRKCISLLVETRAAGGNLLLDVGPKPNGELPLQEEDRLREIALWMFANGECIYGVRPWVVTHEKDIWFTRQKDSDTLYAIVDDDREWALGEWREITLKSVRATDRTEASVLGQNGKVVESHLGLVPLGVVPKTTWHQESDGLHIRAMRAQRFHDDRHWPDPLVLKLTSIKPGFVPPRAETLQANWKNGEALFEGRLQSLGDSESLKVGFEYQDITGVDDLHQRSSEWSHTPAVELRAAGNVSAQVGGLVSGRTYEVRVRMEHPLANFYGQELRFQVP